MVLSLTTAVVPSARSTVYLIVFGIWGSYRLLAAAPIQSHTMSHTPMYPKHAMSRTMSLYVYGQLHDLGLLFPT